MLATPDPETIPTAVGAVVGALAVDGQLVPAQQATLEAFVRVFGDGSLDVGAVEALGPDEVAAAIVDPAVRHQVVQAMVVLAFMEHPPSAERQRSIRRYARALHVDDKAVKVLGEYAHGHTKRMLLDTFRYMPMAEWEHAFAQDEGYGTVARSLLATFDKSESPKVAARFHELEHCPPGSLGRKLWEMYQANGWPFPGERMGVPEATTVHDWVHILAGYAPTPIGEIQVTTFIATCCPDPKLFGAVLLSLGLYEAGAFRLPQFPQAPTGGVMERPHSADALADAVRRGLAVSTDIMEGIDHWALADESVAELRERFHVVAKDEPEPTADPGV